MATRLGAEDYIYEELAEWAKLPEGWSFMEVADVVVDSQDRVYVFNRGEHPMIIFERTAALSLHGERICLAAPTALLSVPMECSIVWTTAITQSGNVPPMARS